MSDKLIKALARGKRVAIYINETTNIVETARVKHDLWPTASAALGRTMSMASIMGSCLKEEEQKITVQINGGGPIGTIMADGFANGNVRGFVGDPHQYFVYNDSKKLAVATAVGNEGYLKVIKDLRLKDNFSGMVELQTGEIGEDFAYYYAVSEQIPSVVSVGVLVSPENTILASGGLLIQMLPDATEEDIVATEELLKTLKPISELLNSNMKLEDILNSLYDDIEIIETKEIKFQCDCDKAKMKRAITTLPKEDRLKLIEEDHGCECKCEYCSTKYNISEEELIDLENLIQRYAKDEVVH